MAKLSKHSPECVIKVFRGDSWLIFSISRHYFASLRADLFSALLLIGLVSWHPLEGLGRSVCAQL